MPPRLFTPRTWLPATPINADSTGTPATPSASSTARRMELTVEIEIDDQSFAQALGFGRAQRQKFQLPSSSSSAISAHVFVLPISSATMYRSFFVKPPLLARIPLVCFAGMLSRRDLRQRRLR